MAPYSLLIVSGILWLYRGIYAEVVGALPLNGGAYNALLNTTSKRVASLAACLTILSYLATCVISASEAVHYGLQVVKHFESSSLLYSHEFAMILTVVLLFVFALLTIRGIGESAHVALCIFFFHIASLILLLIGTIVFVSVNGLSVFMENWHSPPPRATSYPLLFGFFVAMLGISGFESSANFVEEQKPGVFPKTLRNMWLAVSFFNPLICLCILAVVPLAHVASHQQALLAYLAKSLGGEQFGTVFSTIISIDAALVLSGAVLTSFVGVTGLVHRMTLDRCLPQALLNPSRYKTFHRVILGFFLLSCLLLYIAKDVHNLAGVYTISFLAVMFLFAVGNGLLKTYRGRLPRETEVSWLTIIIAAIAVALGLGGNIYLNTDYLLIFLFYFIPSVLIVGIMLGRTAILKGGIYAIKKIAAKILVLSKRLTASMEQRLNQINSLEVVFFTRGDNLANLNQAMLYVRANEQTNRVKVVTIVNNKDEVPEKLKSDLAYLNEAYPDIKISLVIIEGKFSRELLDKLSEEWAIPLNFMFIGSPGRSFALKLADLGGVRLII